MSDTAYIEIMEANWGTSYKPLMPTGRWKIESGPYYENCMFVEHQGWLFKSWISERSISFRPAVTRAVFTCEPPTTTGDE